MYETRQGTRWCSRRPLPQFQGAGTLKAFPPSGSPLGAQEGSSTELSFILADSTVSRGLPEVLSCEARRRTDWYVSEPVQQQKSLLLPHPVVPDLVTGEALRPPIHPGGGDRLCQHHHLLILGAEKGGWGPAQSSPFPSSSSLLFSFVSACWLVPNKKADWQLASLFFFFFLWDWSSDIREGRSRGLLQFGAHKLICDFCH